MIEAFFKIFGINIKKRIEESPGILIIDLRKIELKDGNLKVPIKFDFPEEK